MNRVDGVTPVEYNYLAWGTHPAYGFNDKWLANPGSIFFVDSVDEDPRADWVRQYIATKYNLELIRTVPVIPVPTIENPAAVGAIATGVEIGNNTEQTSLLIRIYARPDTAIYTRVLSDRTSLLSFIPSPDPANPAKVITEYTRALCGTDPVPVRGVLRSVWLGDRSLLGNQRVPAEVDADLYVANRVAWAHMMQFRRNWIMGDALNTVRDPAVPGYKNWLRIVDLVGLTQNWLYTTATTAAQFPHSARDYDESWQTYRSQRE